MITDIRVRNLRSVKDSGTIKLARVNILVGKNSAGKSTILRVLPLLRQSAEKPTKGPMLWYGRLVDFGSFQNAVNSAAKADGVTIDFVMTLADRGKRINAAAPIQYLASFNRLLYRDLRDVRVELAIGQGEEDVVGRTRSVKCSLGSDVVELLIREQGAPQIIVNGSPTDLGSGRRWLSQAGKIIPIPSAVRTDRMEIEGRLTTYYILDEELLSERVLEALRPLFHGNTSSAKISEIAGMLRYTDKMNFLAQLKGISASAPTFQYHLNQLNEDSDEILKIREAVLLASVTDLFRRIDAEITGFADSVKYVEPIRATAQRYYRLQDLAVDEIDSRGENTAMFLSSLSASEMRALRGWMNSTLGFHAYVEQEGGHVQVKIGERGARGGSKNIADLGFGYSQLLPIILQLWRSMVKPLSRASSIPLLAIEQPELHLHPQFQAQISDVIVATLGRQNEHSGTLIFETHSEHIINRLGQLVAQGKLDKDHVQILVVEGTGVCSVQSVKFDERGFLDSKWPTGFFVPETPE